MKSNTDVNLVKFIEVSNIEDFSLELLHTHYLPIIFFDFRQYMSYIHQQKSDHKYLIPFNEKKNK